MPLILPLWCVIFGDVDCKDHWWCRMIQQGSHSKCAPHTAWMVYWSPSGRHKVQNTQKPLQLLPWELVISGEIGRLELNFSWYKKNPESCLKSAVFGGCRTFQWVKIALPGPKLLLSCRTCLYGMVPQKSWVCDSSDGAEEQCSVCSC